MRMVEEWKTIKYRPCKNGERERKGRSQRVLHGIAEQEVEKDKKRKKRVE